MPSKPDTPLADQLRADFWAWYHRDMQHLLLYKKTFREWAAFTKSDTSKAKPDHDSIAERLKAAAIDAQVAWAEHHAEFERWKAANPAVGPIIANAHQDTKAIRAAEKQKAERADFVRNDLRGKSEKQQQQELARYDHFTRLMAQSREREMWRTRVEAQIKAQAMIEEQNCIAAAAAAAAAEEERRKAEAEELERQRKEAEAEEQRKLADARAAEEERLLREKPAAAAAQAAEKEKAEEQARREATAQRLADESLLLQMLGFPEVNRSGSLGSNTPHDWNGDLFAGVTTDIAAQQWAQENYMSDKICGDPDNFDHQFQEAFQFADDLLLPSNEPLDFDATFAEQDAVLPTGDLLGIDVPTLMQLDTAPAHQVAHLQFSLGGGSRDVMAQKKDISAERFLPLVQPQIPSVPAAMSSNEAGQPVTTRTQVSAESSTGKKRPSRKRVNPKTQPNATANPKSIPTAMSSEEAQHQLSEPSFGLGQVMALDPFVTSANTHELPSSGQGTFSLNKPATELTPRDDPAAVSPAGHMSHVADTTAPDQMEHKSFRAQEYSGPSSPKIQQQMSQMSQMPAMDLTSHGTAGPIVQKPPQDPSDYTIFMKRPSQASSPASLSSVQMPSAHISAHAAATLSLDNNKRKASVSHGAETPTKRRQTVNRQAAVVPIPQSPPVPVSSQGLQTPARTAQLPAQGLQTPQQQVPIDPALHYGISPPSGGVLFGTSIKAGVCAAIAHIVMEAKLGTVFSQVLLDGPIADFGCPEISGHIKQATKSHLIAVSAAGPEDDRQAFLSGAFKVLQGILHEIEERGSVFGKALLDGPMSGPALMPARKAMSTVYKAVMAEYRSPPRFEGDSVRPTQVQQTPTRMSLARSRISSRSSMGNGSAVAGSPHLPTRPGGPDTFIHGRTTSPQTNGHAASSSPMQPFPMLSAEDGGYPSSNHAYPSPPSLMTGYTVPDCQQPAVSKPAAAQRSSHTHDDVPEPTNYYPQEQQQVLEQQQAGQAPQKSKRASARRKSRARKSSTPAVMPNSQPPTDDNTATTTMSTTATAAAAATGDTTPSPGGQCIPKLYYRFADGAFYMQLQTASGEVTHHRIGAKGTTAAEAALGRFLAEAGARLGGVAECPAGFVFRAWEGVEENLRALERALSS
ncbi:hypothetical protein MYCTH_2071057 [Thermothelomyces thermophilus ATCC 42464]|uniref:Uncharacterized protein n=1 Tax=Thermothelomyces thermophilus (strain ATCC 42464 / BCRC 31852 / DSM 1799) TaxID=573729 RepID=G2QPQ7_THET4|nr:uncharacterized protein MYCTH_2071057 [Thermothelomyces thermophilus ATCC 42464]AEO61570.1 hypothetical protein MYCTH_2071057 [Thermothelomyces thermophilus ATCC 42464]